MSSSTNELSDEDGLISQLGQFGPGELESVYKSTDVAGNKDPKSKMKSNDRRFLLRHCKNKTQTPVPMDERSAEFLETLIKLQDGFLEDLDSFLDEDKMKAAQMEYAVITVQSARNISNSKFIPNY